MGALTMPVREKLDNLMFVINCNLQRLDGPVRGNGKIIQELEAAFLGAGWNVIKVLWGSRWDPLLARDTKGSCGSVMEECVDGEYQNFKAKGGAYTREHFFGKYPELKEMVANMSDEEIWRLNRGGHDPQQGLRGLRGGGRAQGPADGDPRARPSRASAWARRARARRSPTSRRSSTRSRCSELPRPLQHPDQRRGHRQALASASRPQDSEEMRYLQARRAALGGYLPGATPTRRRWSCRRSRPSSRCSRARGDREISTTMAFVRILTALLKDKNIGKHIVPIVPDEARTFGMEGMFRQIGIYSSVGQLYTPQDADQLMFYREDKKGQILEEGINEAGAICSWIAAATAYANHGVSMVPFYIYYSMFGFQRVGDFIWAAGDSQARGFLLGGTAGRTTLAGEGLQHQDGHSQLVATTVPNCVAYDPAYAYELAVIIQDGMRRMYVEQRERLLLHHLMNENYVQPAMPAGAEAGILKGVYLLQAGGNGKLRVTLLGSGTILREVIAAAELLREGLRGRRRRVLGHQLQRAAARGAGDRALEPAASGRSGHACPTCSSSSRARRRRSSRRPTTCASCRTRSGSGSAAAT